MYRLKDYLNKIGEFSCKTENGKSTAIGILLREDTDNNCIIFRGRIPLADRHVFDGPSLDLHGAIDMIEVSLLNCYIKSSSCRVEADFLNAVFVLDRIVIGDYYKGEKSIQCISGEFQALNYFFLNHVGLSMAGDVRKEFFSSNPPLTAETSFGSISVQPFLASNSSFHQMVLRSVPVVTYSFKSPKTLDAAILHIASLRNLFSFFADGYIELGPFEYSVYSNTIPSQNGDEVTVFLNHRATLPEVDVPFLLTRKSVEKDFETIVGKWLDFYQNSIYIPALFFEIITSRSKGVNAFLNLAQAVEIYSSYFRNEEAKIVCNNDPEAEIPDTPSLKHRLIDVLTYLKDILAVTEEDCLNLAKVISKNRNFYTHYSNKGKEPSFQTVSRMIVFLRFVLLALIYKHIGVEDQAIQSCKRAGLYTTMDETIQIILANKPASKTILES